MNIQEKKLEFEKVLDHAQQDFGSVRTSRATPALIENVIVDVYGSKTPLMQIGSITSPEPKQLLVEVWDKSVLKEAEKAIQNASLGLSVNNEGSHLRVIIPAMTEETRNPKRTLFYWRQTFHELCNWVSNAIRQWSNGSYS